ncbi:hypothetical protein ACIPSA_30660 [Streptomyces sp. NPDC086549]|uniref:hypothetical protein n=1 Tax=Streptomyces sp. NPDC086549 TaxID=3365752 RepID=UPI0037FA288B
MWEGEMLFELEGEPERVIKAGELWPTTKSWPSANTCELPVRARDLRMMSDP